MPVPLSATEGILVAHYALVATRLMAARGHPAEALLAGTGLRVDDLERHPGHFLSLPALLKLLENLHTLDTSPTLSYELGLQMDIGSHGFLGYAVQASATFGEALLLVQHYARTRTQLIDVSVSIAGEQAILEINDNGLLGPWFQRVMEALLASFRVIQHALFNQLDLGAVEVRLTFPEPLHHEYLQAAGQIRIHYDEAANRISIPLSWLTQPLPQPDRQLAALAAARCREELAVAEQGRDFALRVRQLIQMHIADAVPHERVAAELNMTPRTLHRRLQASGLGFKTLLDDLKRNQAVLRLRHSDDAVSDIAAALGYSDPGNFVRAFRRWTGCTPSGFRRG